MRKIAGLSLLVLGTAGLAWWAHGHHARIIQTKVSLAAQAVPLDTTHDVQLRVAGRDIIVSGTADTADEAADIVAQLAQVPGHRVVQTELRILPSAAPYTFSATKPEGADIQDAIGVAPTAAVASDITGQVPDADLELAHGAPAQWGAAIESGIAALRETVSGQLTVTDATLAVSGVVQSHQELDAINQALGQLPDSFDATTDLTLLDDGQPADFTLTYDATTGARFNGRITDGLAGADLGARLGAADITDDSQSDLASDAVRHADTDQTRAVIEALAPQMPQIETLVMAVKGARPDHLSIAAQLDLSVAAGADPQAVAAAVTQALPAELGAAVTIAAQPAARITSDTDTRIHQTTGVQQHLIDGQWVEAQSPYTLQATKTGAGITFHHTLVPDAATRTALATAANVDPATLTPAYGAPDGWQDAALSGVQALGLLADGTLDITDRVLTLSGDVPTPTQAAAVTAALDALPPAFTAETSITTLDDGEAAGFQMHYTPTDGVTVDGRLHTGIMPADLARALSLRDIIGTPAQDSSPSDGSDAAYAISVLQALAPLVPTAEEITVTIPESPATDGARVAIRLAAGTDDAAAAALAAALPSGTELTMDVETPQATDDGTTRVNASTGQSEQLRNGYWLPVWDFTPTPETCATQSALVLRDYQVTFVSGSAEIDASSDRALAALAAVMDPCIAANLTAELGGHTDSTGSAELNQKLSQGRADAVMAALSELGVPADAMVAKGYGPDKPVASNDTEEGRALNRRTELVWTAAETAAPTDN